MVHNMDPLWDIQQNDIILLILFAKFFDCQVFLWLTHPTDNLNISYTPEDESSNIHHNHFFDY